MVRNLMAVHLPERIYTDALPMAREGLIAMQQLVVANTDVEEQVNLHKVLREGLMELVSVTSPVTPTRDHDARYKAHGIAIGLGLLLNELLKGGD